jgi:hypothetical protein
VSGLSGWPAFRGVSMEVWSQWKPGLLSVFLPARTGDRGVSPNYPNVQRTSPFDVYAAPENRRDKAHRNHSRPITRSPADQATYPAPPTPQTSSVQAVGRSLYVVTWLGQAGDRGVYRQMTLTYNIQCPIHVYAAPENRRPHPRHKWPTCAPARRHIGTCPKRKRKKQTNNEDPGREKSYIKCNN